MSDFAWWEESTGVLSAGQPECVLRIQGAGAVALMEFMTDGRIFVRGELCDSNKAVCEAFVAWAQGRMSDVEKERDAWRELAAAKYSAPDTIQVVVWRRIEAAEEALRALGVDHNTGKPL